MKNEPLRLRILQMDVMRMLRLRGKAGVGRLEIFGRRSVRLIQIRFPIMGILLVKKVAKNINKVQ